MPSTVSRLETIAPGICAKLQRASLEKRRRAALLACQRAISWVGLEDPTIEEVLNAVRQDSALPLESRSQLEGLVESFDELYFQLSESSSNEMRGPRSSKEVQDQAMSLFSKARAASALAITVFEDSDQLQEAIYEALAAFEDPGELIQELDSALD